MWKLLKAELKYYYKLPLIITLCLIMWLFILFSIWGGSRLEQDLLGFFILAMCVTGVSWFIMVMNKQITRRARFHAGLPVSVGLIGISQLMITIVFWLSVVLCFCMALLTLRPDIKEADIFWKFISFNGVILFFNADYTLSRDLYYGITGKSKILGIHNDLLPTVLLPLVNALILLYFAIPHAFHFSVPLRDQLVNAIFSPAGAILLNFLGLGLSYLSVVVYVRRRSFLV